MGELGELGVDEPRGCGVQRDGLLGDPPGLPHRQSPRHHLVPQPREPVPELDDLPDVVPGALLRHRQGDREVGDRELPHRERTLTGQAQDPLGAELPGLRLEVLDHIQRTTGAGPLLGVADPVTVRPRRDRTELGHLCTLGAGPVLRDARQHRLVVQTEHVDLVARGGRGDDPSSLCGTDSLASSAARGAGCHGTEPTVGHRQFWAEMGRILNQRWEISRSVPATAYLSHQSAANDEFQR